MRKAGAEVVHAGQQNAILVAHFCLRKNLRKILIQSFHCIINHTRLTLDKYRRTVMSTIEYLNSEYALEGQLHFMYGEGEFPLIVIENDLANAIISTYAGQILSFQPVDAEEDLLFISEQAYYQSGKAIKGGIPICWPWFGADPENKGRAAHGFVRNRQWNVLATQKLSDGSTQVRLGINDNEETRKIWPYSFQLMIEITVGTSLSINLRTQNTGNESFVIGQALHTYFKVGNINQVQVLGLDNLYYLDKANHGLQKRQQGPVLITSEVDRIYTDVNNELHIIDASLKRKISITCSGSKTAVVWNPWKDIAASMGDLDDNDYQHLLCVETVNTENDIVEIQPANEYQLKVNYSVSIHK